MLEEVVSFRGRIERSLAEQNFAELKEASAECEVFMRAKLPTLSGDSEDLSSVLVELEQLIDIYTRAVIAVSEAKEQTVKQLSSLGKSRSNTKTYLDVARHLTP